MFILVEIGCIDYRMKSLRGILPETLYKSSLWIVLALKLIQILTNDKSNHINTNPVLLLLQKEGVLEVGDRDRYEGTVRIITRQCEQPAGTLADFTIFFLGMYD